MEDLLQSIIKESSSKQHQNLKQAAQIAHGKARRGRDQLDIKGTFDLSDKLFRQHGINRERAPPYELRSVCFIALKMALDSKRSNLITLGMNGMHVSVQLVV
jgi:brefeldin A-inhibited guanine nucleotide-exchange protein 3